MKQSTKGKLASIVMAGAMAVSMVVPASACVKGNTFNVPQGAFSTVVAQAEETVNNMSKQTESLANQLTFTKNPTSDFAKNHETLRNGLSNIVKDNTAQFMNGIHA